MREATFTSPLKAASVPFKATGVWRAVVTAVTGTGVWVTVPRLSGDLVYGPLDVVAPNEVAMPVVADPVLVGFVEGRQDELVVLGVVKTVVPPSPEVVVKVTASTTGTAAGQVIDTVSATSYRSVKYVVQAVAATGYRVSELIVVHDGTNVSFNEYGVVVMGTDPVGTYDANLVTGAIPPGSLVLSVTPTADPVTFQLTRAATSV